MNSSRAIFWNVALLLDEWFCSFWTLCWSNTDLIVSMLTWQRPCFRKEGPQIHICIKPTEKREERRSAAGARWWTGSGASSSNQVGPTTLPTTHTLPALQNRLNYRFHLLWNARRSTLSTLSSTWHFVYEIIKTLLCFLQNQSHLQQLFDMGPK